MLKIDELAERKMDYLQIKKKLKYQKKVILLLGLIEIENTTSQLQLKKMANQKK